MLTQYFEAAMSHAEYEWLDEDEVYFGSIPGLQGLWASGATVESCKTELRSALEDWVLIGLQFRDDIPEIDGVRIPVMASA